MTSRIKKPKFLKFRPDTRKFLVNVYQDYQIDDPAGFKLLEVAGGALDRLQEAQEILKREGITINDRNGNSKMHPACIIEKDARAHFLMALKSLNLDVEPLRDMGRPPIRGGYAK